MSHPDGAQWRRSDTQQDEPVSRPRLLDQVRDVIRCKHYSIRTEQTYLDWIKRYILFHNKQHPASLSERHVEAFLTHLAVNRNVSSSTQNQALCAIVFLYRDVLKMTLGKFEQITWAKKPQKLPVVFTREEVKQLLSTGMQKCTKNGNEKCTTSRKPVMVKSSFKGGDGHDFMGAIHGHFGITSARVELA